MAELVVSGWGMTSFGKHLDRGIDDLAAEAVRAALGEAHLAPANVEFVAFANVMAGATNGQNSIRGQSFLRGTGLEDSAIVNVENACASGGTAFHLAYLAVASGMYEVALAVGSEKMQVEDRAQLAKAMLSGVDLDELDLVRARVGADNPEREGAFMMDIYAHAAREYMARTGATASDLAQVSVKNRAHGSHNPRSQFRDPVTVDEVLASRQISPPLQLLMCSPLSDGAAALVITTKERAQAAGADYVEIAASTLKRGSHERREPAASRAAAAAFEAAAVGPYDIDVIELHDACSYAELAAYEQLGLCGPGQAPALLASGATTLAGRIPVNPSGGLLAKGHPVGATGCAQVVELTEQLLGRAGTRQAEGARLALAMNVGGFVGTSDSAACTVTLLRR